MPTSITLDRFGMAVFNSTFAVAILGHVERNEYELIELDPEPLTEDALKDFAQRGFTFLGVIAFHGGEGRPRTALDHDFDAETISALSRRFLDMLERELNARVAKQVCERVTDSLEWLSRLHMLPDLRNKGMEN